MYATQHTSTPIQVNANAADVRNTDAKCGAAHAHPRTVDRPTDAVPCFGVTAAAVHIWRGAAVPRSGRRVMQDYPAAGTRFALLRRLLLWRRRCGLRCVPDTEIMRACIFVLMHRWAACTLCLHVRLCAGSCVCPFPGPHAPCLQTSMQYKCDRAYTITRILTRGMTPWHPCQTRAGVPSPGLVARACCWQTCDGGRQVELRVCGGRKLRERKEEEVGVGVATRALESAFGRHRSRSSKYIKQG